jgi:DNA topoisomerase VI subunit A
MIANVTEYEKAQEEIRDLEERLRRLQQANPVGTKGFTKAGIRKLIARLHEELAVFEGSAEARKPTTTSS